MTSLQPTRIAAEPELPEKHRPRANFAAQVIVESFVDEPAIRSAQVQGPRGLSSRRMTAVIVILFLASVVGGALAIWNLMPMTGRVAAEIHYSQLRPTMDRTTFQTAQTTRLLDSDARFSAVKTLARESASAEPGFLDLQAAQKLELDWHWQTDHATLVVACQSTDPRADAERLSALVNTYERAFDSARPDVDQLKLKLRQAELQQAQSDLDYAQRRVSELEQDVAVLEAISPATQPSGATDRVADKRQELAQMQFRAQQYQSLVKQKSDEVAGLADQSIESNPQIQIQPAHVIHTRDARPWAIGGLALAAGFVMMTWGFACLREGF